MHASAALGGGWRAADRASLHGGCRATAKRGQAGPPRRGVEGGHERRDRLAIAAERVPAREQARWVRWRRAASHWGRPNARKPEGDFG
jgi:hypothetical protein